MQYVLIIHTVKDYDTWKRIFDEAAELRTTAGELNYQLLSFEENPNTIVHFSRWKSLVAAKAFFESAEVVEIRRKAGVELPEFIYLRELETGLLGQLVSP